MANDVIATGPDPAQRTRQRMVLLVVGGGTLISTISGSTVNLALPEIALYLQISITTASWILTSMLLAVTVLLLPAGKLGDLAGHKPVYIWGFVLLAAASLACGLANGLWPLIAARSCQGVAGAMIMSTGPALLTTTFPPRDRGRALGMLATATYIGLTAGPIVGGWILATLGWRWIFFANVPASVIAVALGVAFLPRTAARVTPGSLRGYDWAGTATLVVGLPLALLAIVQGRSWGWTSAATLAVAVAGTGLLAAFVLVERVAKQPLLDLTLLRSRRFSSGVVSAVGNYVSLFIPLILVPFYLMEALRISQEHAGMVLAAQPIVMALVATPSGRLSDRVGTRILATVGLLVLAVGIAGLSTVGPSTPLHVTAIWLAVIGLGTGIFVSPNSSAIMGSAPRAQQGVAGGMMSISRTVGMMVGIAAATSIFQSLGGRTGHTWVEADYGALRICLVVAACVCLATAIVAALGGGNARDQG